MRTFYTKLIGSIQHLDTIRLSPLYPYNRWSTKLSRQVLLHVSYDSNSETPSSCSWTTAVVDAVICETGG